MGWRPECSQAQTINVNRALPPDQEQAQLSVERILLDQPSIRTINNMEVQLGRVQVTGGVIHVDEITPTAVCFLLDNKPQLRHGHVHGRSLIGADSS